LIDTGASVSLIKKSEIAPYVCIDTEQIIYLKGITEHLMKTLGKIRINFGGNIVDLHVIEDDYSLPSGILGTDVFRKCKASINYEKECIENEDMVIPFLNNCKIKANTKRNEEVKNDQVLEWGKEESWDPQINKIDAKFDDKNEAIYENDKLLGEKAQAKEAEVSKIYGSKSILGCHNIKI